MEVSSAALLYGLVHVLLPKKWLPSEMMWNGRQKWKKWMVKQKPN